MMWRGGSLLVKIGSGGGIPPSKSWLGKNLIPALFGMDQDAFLL